MWECAFVVRSKAHCQVVIKIQPKTEEMLTAFPGSSIQVCLGFLTSTVEMNHTQRSMNRLVLQSNLFCNSSRQLSAQQSTKNGICTKKGIVPTRKELDMTRPGTSGACSSSPSIRLVHHTPVPAKVRDPMTMNSSASPRGRLSKYRLYTAPIITEPCHGDRHGGT